MADLTITPANVVWSSGPKATGVAGETVTAGMPVYLKESDGKFWKADNNAGAAPSMVYGLTLHGAAADQPLNVALATAIVSFGAILTVGETYIQSSTAGGIAPIADVSTNYVSYVGVGKTTSTMLLLLTGSGVQHA